MKAFRFNQRKRGFTIIEAMFGMFVTVMGSMSVLSLMSMSVRVNRQSEVRSIATSIARKRLETIRQMASENRVPATHADFAIPPSLLAQFPSGTDGIEMRGRYSVTNIPGEKGLQQITVLVTWRNITRGGKFVDAPWSETALTTMVCRQPMSISYTGVIDPPPPPPPTSGGTTGSTTGGYTPPAPAPAPDPDPTTGGSSSSGGSTGGDSYGECTYTYGPC